ncbi:hypothetical protein NWP21_11455 [Anabaenopsis sp. FSS-46]|uniref:hypothetical protein n=1 Tax=Anabaenopsis sp. FSS-46 TaxID=2971766 RepID=UPI00247382BC|nr:hypothetical protein [Anabaenopsis sp. FSS-46]MDH6099443.1 hypothetical protein [Anabaenopsis sp. FSS-46]
MLLFIYLANFHVYFQLCFSSRLLRVSQVSYPKYSDRSQLKDVCQGDRSQLEDVCQGGSLLVKGCLLGRSPLSGYAT